MRIITGSLKGRRLRVTDSPTMRPTTDRVREAVFASLAAGVSFSDSIVVDFFAGTGSLGIEALSRGARFAVFVEKERKLSAALEENLENFGLAERAVVLTEDVRKSLAQVNETVCRWESSSLKLRRILFADPPYDAHPGLPFIFDLAHADLISQNTILVVGSSKNFVMELPEKNAADLNLSPREQRSKIYGDTKISYYYF